MKKIITAVILLMTVGCISAIPARPGVVKVKMADGSMVDATVVGDEYWHCIVDGAGDVLAENNNGLYEKSAVRLGDIDVKAKMKAGRRAKAVARKPMSSSTFTRGLVILVSFSDKTFTKTNAAFDKMLNEESSNPNTDRGSARDYFANSSFGAFVPHFDVYGPYTLNNKCSYYGGNSGGIDSNAGQMIVDAVAAFIAENGENALQQYDCDGDDYVDNVFVFYAGHGENAGGGSSCIWPHRSFVYPGWVSGRTTYGGVSLGDYACTCELQGASGSTMSGIGPFCHEFSHVIGLPDMYDTEYSGHRTCSLWDIMDAGAYLNNERTPPSYSAYERFYLGWLTPEILNEPDNVRLYALNGSNQAKIITSTGSHNLDGDDPDPEEFYMLEVKDGKGWDKYLPGQGMLITKVKYDYYKWVCNEVNNTASDMGVDIIEAGGVTGYYASDSDPFPGTDNVTSYTPYSNQPITEITEFRDYVTFKFMGGRVKFKVTFDGMGHGTPTVDEIMESVQHQGVLMPEVEDVEDGYTFEGWSESASALVTDAGNSGEVYYPEIDIRLFAVYSYGGQIVPTETECVTETFDHCTGKTSIGGNMDRCTDITGWYGKTVTSNNGSVKIGSNDDKGVISSPRMHLSGDMTLEIVCKALMNTNLIVTAENGNSDTVAIGMDFDTVTLFIPAVPMDSRLTFTAEAQIFFLDNVEFCGARKSPVEDVADEQYVLLRSGEGIAVAGLKGGEKIRIFDMLGRVVDERTAEESVEYFMTGRGLNIVQIVDNGKVTVLK